MKKIERILNIFTFFLLPATFILFCISWHYENRMGIHYFGYGIMFFLCIALGVRTPYLLLKEKKSFKNIALSILLFSGCVLGIKYVLKHPYEPYKSIIKNQDRYNEHQIYIPNN